MGELSINYVHLNNAQIF